MTELDKYLANEPEVELVNVIEVAVSKEVACQRVLGRAADAEVIRADDNVEVFNNRMKLFTDPLSEIQAFYTAKNILKEINGERTIEVIVDEMDKFIQSRI
jgi:adenylate kinase